MGELIFIEHTPLEKHNYRYSDKYLNKARLDSLHWRLLCYECGKLIFQYDPEDESYIKCHNCGSRKRVPQNIVDFTPDWANEQRRKDGFAWFMAHFATIDDKEEES